MTYGAITVDTSIFAQNGYRLSGGLIAQLTQFKDKPVGMVLSEIVTRELHKHLTEKTRESTHQLEKCLRAYRELEIATQKEIDEATERLSTEISASNIAKATIQRFIDATSSTLIEVSEITDFRELVRRYFEQDSPFGAGSKKKHEFPDAMALLSLESWAKNNNVRLLAVSSDEDWKAFSKDSEYIDFKNDLASALALFQPDNTSKEFAESLGQMLSERPDAEISEAILERVAEEVAAAPFLSDVDGPFPVIEDYVELNVATVEYSADTSIVAVQAQESSLALRATFSVTGSAHGSFEFEMKDSIDRDYISMGSGHESVPFEIETDFLIQLSGNFAGDAEEVSIDSVKLLGDIGWIDFGYVEPDWMNEPPDER